MHADYFQVILDSGTNVFVKTMVTETINHLITAKWRTDTDIGKDILEQFSSPDVVDKFSQKISKDILTFKSLSSAGRNINLNDVYYPLTLTVEDNGDQIKVEDGITIPHQGVIVISGSAGQGKTTVLRKLFLEEIKAKNKFPIFISLREVKFDEGLTPVDVVKKFFVDYGIECTDESVSFLMQSSKLIIFYDGFDEVTQINRKYAREMIKATWNRYNCPSIVTTRPYTEIYREGGCKNFKVNKLAASELEGIIGKISHDENQKEALISLVKSKDFLLEALIYPIMIEILIVSYYGMRGTPKTIKDFYAALFKNLMFSHDRLKHFERHKFSQLDVDELEMVFDAFSACTFFKDRYQFSERQLDGFFTKSLEFISQANGKDYHPKDIRKDIIEGTNLISQDGNDFYTYIHRSIQEYHAAHFYIYSDDKISLMRELIFEDDPAKINFLRFLYQTCPKDFLLYYVVPYMRSLGFVGSYELSYGFSLQQIVNKIIPGTTIEFSSQKNKVRTKSINVVFGDKNKTMKSFRRLKFLVGVLQDIFNPELNNGYLSKIELRRNPYINTTAFADLIQTGVFKPEDYTIACSIVHPKNEAQDMIYLHTTELSTIVDHINTFSVINQDYKLYKDLLSYIVEFHKEHIKPFYETKIKRSKFKDFDIDF